MAEVPFDNLAFRRTNGPSVFDKKTARKHPAGERFMSILFEGSEKPAAHLAQGRDLVDGELPTLPKGLQRRSVQ
jgi:hypothetical protein